MTAVSPAARSTLASAKRPKGESRVSILALLLIITVFLCLAWVRREDKLINPGHGWGYALGIIGAVMMLVLLLYPLRKRIRFMRTWGPASVWFRWHMMLGVIGPALIILHSNYKLHSANATVAFISMLTVAGSGLAGRYLYGQVHRGLYGQRLEAKTLRDDAVGSREQIAGDLPGMARWFAELTEFEETALSPTRTLGAATARALSIGAAIRRSRKSILPKIEAELASVARIRGWDQRTLRDWRRAEMGQLRAYYTAVRKAATLGVYERMLSLWHVLHVPLFALLVLTAIIHVIAVHLY